MLTISTLAVGLTMIVSITGTVTFIFGILLSQAGEADLQRARLTITTLNFDDPIAAFGHFNVNERKLVIRESITCPIKDCSLWFWGDLALDAISYLGDGCTLRNLLI